MVSMTLLESGRKLDNYAIDATGGGLFTSTSTYVAECPVGKRWYLLGGVFNRSQNASANVSIYSSGGTLQHRVSSYAAATGITTYPCTNAAVDCMIPPPVFIIDHDEYLQITFGAVQDAACYATCVVIEVDWGS